MPITTVDFLRAVLPNEGLYCCFVLPDKKHFWTKDIDELADFILQADAEEKTVYHACASYRSDSTRKKSNVLNLRSLWLDVDAGPGKPYATALVAYQALGRFRKLVGLPEPVVVGSGLGLHVYWPLADAMPLDQWLPMAEALKKLCAEHGFEAGPERTADAASILRPVGTHHRKGGTLDVVCSKLVGPYDLALFDCLRTVSEYVYSRALFQSLPQTKRRNLADAAVHIADYLPSNGNQVADQCRQLAAMRDRGGILSEPEWKACLNVLAFCDNGLQLAHEWSSGDPRYDADETNDKFERGKSLTGPTTCHFFESVNTTCKTCPHLGSITSPVDLGRGPPRLAKEQLEFALNVETDESQSHLPRDFKFVGGALMLVVGAKTADEADKLTRITQYPMYVASVNHGELRSDQHSIILKYKQPHEDWRDVEMPLKILFGSSGLSEIIGKGIIVHDGPTFQRFLRDSVELLYSKGKTMVQFEQFGWKEDDSSFLIGRKLYTPTKVVDVDGSPEVVKRSRYLGATPRGSIEGWKDAADRLFAQGVEAQGFALLSAFAAPLMRFHSHDEGGAIVSMHSAKGGQGKTTAMAAACSVYGQKLGLEMTNIDTKVAKGITLGVLGSLPVIFDELSNRDPDAAHEFAQVFTMGRDKLRGTGDGQLIHTANSWQTILITGSNLSLVDTLKSARGGEPMALRVIEFSVNLPATIEHSKGDSLKDQLWANAGHAGDAYIKALVQPETLAYVKAALPKIRDDIIAKYKFGSEHRFWVRTLASVSVASIIVKHLGLVSFSPDRIIEWAIDALTTRKATPGDLYEGSHMLSRFLSANLMGTLIVKGPYERGKRDIMVVKDPTRELAVRTELEGGRIYIDERELRMWMNKQGVSWVDLMRELDQKGILIAHHKLATLGAGTTYSHGQTHCVIINAQHPAMSGVLGDVEKVVQLAGVGR